MSHILSRREPRACVTLSAYETSELHINNTYLTHEPRHVTRISLREPMRTGLVYEQHGNVIMHTYTSWGKASLCTNAPTFSWNHSLWTWMDKYNFRRHNKGISDKYLRPALVDQSERGSPGCLPRTHPRLANLTPPAAGADFCSKQSGWVAGGSSEAPAGVDEQWCF